MVLNRHRSLQDWLKKEDVDLAMFQTKENVFYLSGFHADPHERIIAVFLFREAEPFIICPNMEVNQIKKVFQIGEIIGYSDTDNPWKKIKEAVEKRVSNVKRIGLETDTQWGRVKKLSQLYPEAELIEADEQILLQRLIKSEEEIAKLKEAAKYADFGVELGTKALKEGITELEVVATIEYELKKKGIKQMSFSTMVLFGEKAGDPHGVPGERKLKKGDAVLFDLGVVYEGYCSDITRTVFFDHVPEKGKEIYNIVLHAELLALEACKPGNEIAALDNVARNWIAEKGYGAHFPHRIGHGLGIGVHEYPSLTNMNKNKLLPGMTFTIEPGIYIPNELGVRIEDDVLITENGYETLTKFPKELIVI